MYGLDAPTVYRMIAADRLPSRRVGRTVYVPIDALLRYYQLYTQTPGHIYVDGAMPADFISLSEAAARFNVSLASLRNLLRFRKIHRADLARYHRSRTIYVRVSALLPHLERRRVMRSGRESLSKSATCGMVEER